MGLLGRRAAISFNERCNRRETFQLKNREDDNDSSSGSSRFTYDTAASLSTEPESIVDSFLSLILSDVGSITLGILGLILVVYNRLFLENFDESEMAAIGRESRGDLLAAFAAGGVLLNGVNKLDVTAAVSPRVELEGADVGALAVGDDEGKEIREWALRGAVRGTAAGRSAVIVRNDHGLWKIVGYHGVLPLDVAKTASASGEYSIQHKTPILDKVLKDRRKESYLPTLQALPGKVEFTYLPKNTQGVLLLPCGADDRGHCVLVLACDRAKSLSPKDIVWCRLIADKIAS